MVRELGALEMVRVPVGDHLLEGVRGLDFVCHGLPVHGMADAGVLDLEDTAASGVRVEAAGLGNDGFLRVVSHAVGIEGRARHGEGFFVDESVGEPVEHGVDAKGEDVLVVCGEDAGVHDCAPGDGGQVVVDGLRREDAGGADFVGEFGGLVEDKGQHVLVVCRCDDGLDDEFPVTDE